jgi:alpha-L-arabinofuranosidase
VSVLDAVAAVAPSGELIVLIVQRARDPVTLSLRILDLASEATAEVVTLAGTAPWDRNTETQPQRITPRVTRVQVMAGCVTLELTPCSLTRVIIRGTGSI